MAGVHSVAKPKCGLPADPEGSWPVCCPPGWTVMTLSRVKTPVGRAYVQHQREDRAPLLPLGDCSRALDVRLAREPWAGLLPRLVPVAGVCEQTERVVYGDPDHRAGQ